MDAQKRRTPHGLLHLLGFDHMEAEDEKEMIAMQKAILEALAIGR